MSINQCFDLDRVESDFSPWWMLNFNLRHFHSDMVGALLGYREIVRYVAGYYWLYKGISSITVLIYLIVGYCVSCMGAGSLLYPNKGCSVHQHCYSRNNLRDTFCTKKNYIGLLLPSCLQTYQINFYSDAIAAAQMANIILSVVTCVV